MTSNSKRAILCLMAALLLLGYGVTDATAETITSSDFSFAFGATGGTPYWDETENPGNSPHTQGYFSFSPAVVGSTGMSSDGTIFTNATLSNGDTNSTTGIVGDCMVPITASYNGPAPGDAAAAPDYRLMVEITNISVYGARHVASSSPATLEWDETTAGHTQTSPSITLISGTGLSFWTNASNFTQLVWDPADYDTSLGSLNASFTRTFDILPIGALELRGLDGIEIEGRVHLLYNQIPEPSTLALLASGLVGLLCYAWRKRK